MKGSDSLSVHCVLLRGVPCLGETKSARRSCCYSDGPLLITVNNGATHQLISCCRRGSNVPLLPCTLKRLKTSEQQQSSVSVSCSASRQTGLVLKLTSHILTWHENEVNI